MTAVIAGGPLGRWTHASRYAKGEIATVLGNSAWAESLGYLTSAPGIGLRTAAWLLVATVNFTLGETPEAGVAGCPLGRTGVAPGPRQSGTRVRGKAQIGHGGNARLRTAASLATRSAVRQRALLRVSTSGCGKRGSRSR